MVQPKIDIESPQQDDLKALFTELKTSLSRMSSSDVIDYQLTVDVSTPGATSFVARVDGKPVGTGALVRHGNGVAEAKRLFTEPAYRKHGIGRAILRHIASLAKSEGLRELVIVTDANLKESIAFCEQNGFERTEKVLNHAPTKQSVFFRKAL
ncbi:GNAT family N-acetyltransferase [Martelella lutilitoris]|uniref:GNAT family N-acetyltransferase n=1 Tax=Martelella lutilitoris TaxID=2583532 RepID=A0A7T7HHG2_9HYPH|nr:GNAT family N-acetyltransferase [Martelella lutilitoris]QQM29259.1 GNAT family N-acetyltransferase [Martelella lutilitoris]